MQLPALTLRREGSVIVICPSCQTRYRHDFQAAPAQVAHCGSCDERFEPTPARRTYVLVPGGPVPGAGIPPAAIGMDDPLLAGNMSEAGTPASGDSAVDPGGEAKHGGGRLGPRVTAVLELATAVVPCGLGAGLAYHFAGSLNQDPLISAILGGVTGLLLGWACVLWIAQAD